MGKIKGWKKTFNRSGEVEWTDDTGRKVVVSRWNRGDWRVHLHEDGTSKFITLYYVNNKSQAVAIATDFMRRNP